MAVHEWVLRLNALLIEHGSYNAAVSHIINFVLAGGQACNGWTFKFDLPIDRQCFFINLNKLPRGWTSIYIFVKANDLIDCAGYLLIYGSRSAVNSFNKWYFENVSRSSSAIGMLIDVVDGDACDESLQLPQSAIVVVQFFCLRIKWPYFDCILMHRNEFIGVIIIEWDIGALLIQFIACRHKYLTFALIHVPEN